MMAILAAKATAKDAWDVLKIMRLRVSHVQEAKAATLSKQYTVVHLNDDESIDDLAMRLIGMVNQLNFLGEQIPEMKVV